MYMEKEFICNLKTIFKSITLNLNTYYLIPNKHFPTLACKWSFSICLSQCCHIQPQLTTFTLVESKDKKTMFHYFHYDKTSTAVSCSLT